MYSITTSDHNLLVFIAVPFKPPNALFTKKNIYKVVKGPTVEVIFVNYYLVGTLMDQKRLN